MIIKLAALTLFQKWIYIIINYNVNIVNSVIKFRNKD